MLICRGVSVLFDMITLEVYDSDDNNAMQLINDIQLLIFYFVEAVPSIIIIVVLWRGYKDYQRLTLSREFLLPEEAEVQEH